MSSLKKKSARSTLANQIEDWKYNFYCWRRDLRSTLLAPWRFLKNVWLFRKELWRFRRWDYSFNNNLYIRSWELTAEYLDSEECVTLSGREDAKDIRKFIKLLELSADGIPAAERIMGVDFLDLSRAANGDEGVLSNWSSAPAETWSEDQKKFQEALALAKQIEVRSWKNAWKFMSKNGQRWWE